MIYCLCNIIMDGPLPWSSVESFRRLIMRRCPGVMVERAMTSPTAWLNAVTCNACKMNSVASQQSRKVLQIFERYERADKWESTFTTRLIRVVVIIIFCGDEQCLKQFLRASHGALLERYVTFGHRRLGARPFRRRPFGRRTFGRGVY